MFLSRGDRDLGVAFQTHPGDGELGTLSYVPGSAGLCLAGYVIRKLAGL